MSTIDVGLLLNGVPRSAVGCSNSPLRVVLVEGEALRLPRESAVMRVLSGTAWVSQAGRDTFVRSGERFRPTAGADHAVISPLGRVPLLLEMR